MEDFIKVMLKDYHEANQTSNKELYRGLIVDASELVKELKQELKDIEDDN